MPRVLCFIVLLLLAEAITLLGGEAGPAVPFQIRNGLIVVTAEAQTSAGPKALDLILDTGATATLLDRSAATALGLAEGAPEVIRTATRRTEARAVRGLRGTLAGASLPNRALAIPLHHLGVKLPPCDGILGADFFRGRIVQIDFRRRTVQIGAAIPASGTVLPLRENGGVLSVQAAIDGPRKRWLRLDTGCADALHVTAERPPKPRDSVPSIALAPGAIEYRSVTVRLGGAIVECVNAGLHGSPLFDGEAGLLGNGILARFLVTIDARGRRLYLQ